MKVSPFRLIRNPVMDVLPKNEDLAVQLCKDVIAAHIEALGEASEAVGEKQREVTEADREAVEARMKILAALALGPHREACLPLIVEAFPEAFPQGNA